MLTKQTYSPKESEQDRNWLLIDLDGLVLGRVATRIANLLRGRHKPVYTPHFDMGDFVVAVNAEKIRLTGDKLNKKIYYKHSGYRGGLKETLAADMLAKKPEEMIRLAVSGMLPKNKLRAHFLKKLKIYAGTEHPHEAQRPQKVSINDKEPLPTPPSPQAPISKKAPAKKAAPKAAAKPAAPTAKAAPAEKKAAPKKADAKKTEAPKAKTGAKKTAAPTAKKTTTKKKENA